MAYLLRRGKEGEGAMIPTPWESLKGRSRRREVRRKRPLPPTGMTTREFLREMFRRSPPLRTMSYRQMWRCHPVLLCLWTACGLGLALLGLVDFVHGVPHVWRGVHLGLYAAWFVLWVMLIRRDEPPPER